MDTSRTPRAAAEAGDVPPFHVVQAACERVLDNWRRCNLLQVAIAVTVLRFRGDPTVKQWAQLSRAADQVRPKETHQ
jgi:hypothetical protein